MRAVVILAALILSGGVLRWQGAQVARLAAAHNMHASAPLPPAVADAAPPTGTTPLAVVTAYTAASITAAQTGQVTLLAPYIAADSTVWRRITTEYERRAAVQETHQPTLLRWGIVQQTTTAISATVELQEHWDDVRLRPGQAAVTRQNILQRVRYRLQRPSATDAWQIAAIETQVILAGTTR